jgi:S1-C subfamily serine protease
VGVGQTVIAIGNPFSLGLADDAPTVTVGVVSAVNRFHGSYSDAIQTDAPINPGNSGGPLLTLDGRLIGINGRITTRFGTRSNTGIGYAISINQIKRFLPALKAAKGGRVHHGTVRGLVLKRFNPNTGGEDKAIVARVTPGSTAEQAGFLENDRILSVENYPIVNFSRFAGVLGTYPAGADVNVRVMREGKEIDLAVKLDLRHIPGPVDFGWTLHGVNAASVREHGGVQIEKVRPKGPAEKAGLQAGDVLLELNGIKLDTARSLVRLMRTGFEAGLPVEGKVRRKTKDPDDGREVEREIEFRIRPAKGKRADWGMRGRYSARAGGLAVLRVRSGGPADRAGIKTGDVIVQVGRMRLRNPLLAARLLRMVRPGQTIKGRLKRKVTQDGKQIEKQIEFTLKVGVAK